MRVSPYWLVDKGFEKRGESYHKYIGDIEGDHYLLSVTFENKKVYTYIRQQRKHGYKVLCDIITLPKVQSTVAVEMLWIMISGNKLN
jgi:hypothetical protein